MPNNRFYKKASTYEDVARLIKSYPASYFLHAYLTEGGTVGGDTTFNEDYSSTASATSYVATAPLTIQTVCIEMINGSFAQSVLNNHELWVGNVAALTNGLKFRVENAAGTVLYDITNTIPIKTLAQLDAIGTAVTETFSAADATPANNFHTYSCRINLTTLCGKAVELNTGEKFVCYLNDSFTALTVFYIHVLGYLL
jgi:hypothetical protein